ASIGTAADGDDRRQWRKWVT
ncbi:hypothetical protein A2U01_0088661, partial [Trifolium medium]|nr:hypothetical protein [Trifolium medium]